MNINIQRTFNFLFFTLCFFSTWIIVGAIPYFHLEGMFRTVDTQVFSLHFLGGLLFTFKSLELLLCKEKIKELNNSFFFITFVLGILGLLSAFFNDYFYTTILGSYQIGQGALWYFNFSILILCFSSLIKNSKIKYFFFINICILTLITTFFTLYPYWKGINVSFFYFNDYLCYFGITVFIIFTALTKNRLLVILAYLSLGWYLSILDNRAALLLWLFVFLLFLTYHFFDLFKKYYFIIKFKNFIFSNFILSLSVLAISIIILTFSLIFWKGEGGLPSELGASSLASLVVRGKLIEVLLLDFINFKNILFGEGWGRISDLLIKNMNAWQYDQLTVGYNLHFHTHNEIFEHFFCLGLPGALLFILLIYYILKSSKNISVYNTAGWLLFFYVSCFWFFWAGTLPLFALAIGFLNANNENNFIKKNLQKVITKFSFGNNYLISVIFLLVGSSLFYGSYLSYSYTEEYKKISYGAIAAYTRQQKLSEINCNNYYEDIKGGETVAPFINTFPDYLRLNVFEYDETNLKILEAIQCIAEDIIFNEKPALYLLTASILMDSKMYFSKNKQFKTATNNEEKFEKLKEKVLVLAEMAPKRGDLILPFIAIAFKNNKIDLIDEICSIKNLKGLDGYCNLIYGYKSLNKKLPTQNDITASINYIKKAIAYGILEEKVYGWWLFYDVLDNAENWGPLGTPISADIMFYISRNESEKLLEIMRNFN